MLPTKWKEAHYQWVAREFLDDQVGSSDRTNATPKMASLTASRSTNSMKQSPWAANNATDGKELSETLKVHIHVHNSSNVHPVLIQDNAEPTVTKVYIIFTLTQSSRPDLGLQSYPLSLLKSCTRDYITHTCSPLLFHANYINRPSHTPRMYHHIISMVAHSRLLNYLKVVELDNLVDLALV